MRATCMCSLTLSTDQSMWVRFPSTTDPSTSTLTAPLNVQWVSGRSFSFAPDPPEWGVSIGIYACRSRAVALRDFQQRCDLTREAPEPPRLSSYTQGRTLTQQKTGRDSDLGYANP